jgi:hypothetical protein
MEAMPIANKTVVQTNVFLNFNMMFPLKVNEVITFWNSTIQLFSLLTVVFRFVCDIFPRTIEVYAGNYPSSTTFQIFV